MKFLSITLLLISFSALAGKPAGTKNEDGSFKLTDKAIQTMGVAFESLKSAGPWTLPKDAIVRVKFTEGVYRRYEGDITYVLVKVLQKNGDFVTVQSEDLEPGDEVATKGTTLLRLAEADLNSDTVDACAH